MIVPHGKVPRCNGPLAVNTSIEPHRESAPKPITDMPIDLPSFFFDHPIASRPTCLNARRQVT